MIYTYANLACWLLDNGFRGTEAIHHSETVYKNYDRDSFNAEGRYRVEKSVNKGKAVTYSKDRVEILTYEQTKQYLMKELKMNDVTPEQLETTPVKSVEPDHLELYKKQLDTAEDIIQKIVEDEGLEIGDLDQFFELRDSLMNEETDFEATLDDETYRFIHEDSIERIFKESAVELAQESHYDELDNLPSFIRENIDWQAVAEEMAVDGYGLHFATYDHEEHYNNNYYYFRTN